MVISAFKWIWVILEIQRDPVWCLARKTENRKILSEQASGRIARDYSLQTVPAANPQKSLKLNINVPCLEQLLHHCFKSFGIMHCVNTHVLCTNAFGFNARVDSWWYVGLVQTWLLCVCVGLCILVVPVLSYSITLGLRPSCFHIAVFFSQLKHPLVIYEESRWMV